MKTIQAIDAADPAPTLGGAPEQALTVSRLNSHVRLLLEGNFPRIWVQGEISNLRVPSSGHAYFSLKDQSAQVKCAMFRGMRQQAGLELADGMAVVVRARISLYEPRGDYQMIIDRIQPLGDGDLQRAFEQLKRQLAAQGLFDQALKRVLPTMPRAIGVVTSATGAALQDILHVLARRYPIAEVWVYPTAVQGDQAAGQIVQALEKAQSHGQCDVLLLARGGGSIEDLWPFNEAIVAQAVFDCEIPIVAGVGHEIDFTIVDFVADARAPTPSAAAELASPDQRVLLQQLQAQQTVLIRRVQQHITQARMRLSQAQARCRHPRDRLHAWAQRLDFLNQRLVERVQQRLAHQQQHLVTLGRALDALSPLSTLARGYALVSLAEQRKPLTQAAQAKVGDQVVAKLHQGKLHCRIESIEDS